uniref:Uncharacterized protein n=1 Tax=Meloidogyne enterolobii TaxID=390850 RepID=A0A6V7VL49_MELEN|nr:unnamed protein product [Meloidogyne enterolobii]
MKLKRKIMMRKRLRKKYWYFELNLNECSPVPRKLLSSKIGLTNRHSQVSSGSVSRLCQASI